MAATFTVTKVRPAVDGNRKSYIFDVSCSGTYTTGGDAIEFPGFQKGPAVAPLTNPQPQMRIEQVQFIDLPTDGTVVYPAEYIKSTITAAAKLKFFESGASGVGLAEKGSAESLANVVFRVKVVGN